MAPSSSTTETNLRSSVFKIWLIAVLARLLYAVVSPGFHARDDYFHVLEPALQWLDDPEWIWADSTTPGAGIRSFLLPKVVQGLLEISATLSPSNQLRVIGGFLALWSSLIVPLSLPLIARLSPQNRSNQLFLAWLIALHPALVYGAPKLLIEMQCLPLLMASLSLLVLSRHHLTRQSPVFYSGSPSISGTKQSRPQPSRLYSSCSLEGKPPRNASVCSL